jgi:hypothetical protein
MPRAVAETLFGDAAARPSDVYLQAFLAAALPILEDVFCEGGEQDDEEEAMQGSLGEALAVLLDRCVENGMSYPMILMIVGSNGSVVAAHYAGPGEPPAFLAEHMEGSGIGFPIDGLVTDENGGAAHVRVTPEGMTARLLVPSERPPLRS